MAVFDPPNHPVSLLYSHGNMCFYGHLKNVNFKFYSKFYIECEIEFDMSGIELQACRLTAQHAVDHTTPQIQSI